MTSDYQSPRELVPDNWSSARARFAIALQTQVIITAIKEGFPPGVTPADVIMHGMQAFECIISYEVGEHCERALDAVASIWVNDILAWAQTSFDEATTPGWISALPVEDALDDTLDEEYEVVEETTDCDALARPKLH